MNHQLLLNLHLACAVLWIGAYTLLALEALSAWRRNAPASALRERERAHTALLGVLLLGAFVSGGLLAGHWLPDSELWFNTDLAHARALLLKFAIATLIVLQTGYGHMRFRGELGAGDGGPYLVYLSLQSLAGWVMLLAGSSFRFGGWGD